MVSTCVHPQKLVLAKNQVKKRNKYVEQHNYFLMRKSGPDKFVEEIGPPAIKNLCISDNLEQEQSRKMKNSIVKINMFSCVHNSNRKEEYNTN